MKFTGPKVKTILNCKDFFLRFSNLNNLKKILPKEITGYSSTIDTCSFKIENLPIINLKIKDKISFQKISLVAVDSQVPFTINCHFKEEENITNVFLEIDAEINFLMKIVAEKPIIKILNSLSSCIKHL